MPPLKPALVIFDCDGVLVESEPVVFGVFADFVRELGLSTSREEIIREQKGLSLRQGVALVEQKLGAPLPAGFLDRYRVAFLQALRTELKPVPGVAEALTAIDVPVCVASNSDAERLRLSLEVAGFLPRFEGRMFCASDVKREKPAPDIYLLAASTLDVDPAHVAVVEDSVPGVRAALAAGMTAFGYSAGSEEAAAELAAAG